MTWAEDGLDSDEMTVVAALGGIAGVSMAKRDEAATLRIAAMPFLESVEGVDAAAASSLHSLFWASDEENYLKQVLAHPTLEHGISDAEAFVVAALGVVVEDRPDLLETLLDLGPDAVEKRIIQIPLAGEVTLSVLNVSLAPTAPSTSWNRHCALKKRLWTSPFREATSGLLVADATSAGGGGGPTGIITV